MILNLSSNNDFGLGRKLQRVYRQRAASVETENGAANKGHIALRRHSIQARNSDRPKIPSDLRCSQREIRSLQSLEPRDCILGKIGALIARRSKSQSVGVLRTLVLAGRQTARSSRRSPQCHGQRRKHACQNCRGCEACKQRSHKVAGLHPLPLQTRYFRNRFRETTSLSSRVPPLTD